MLGSELTPTVKKLLDILKTVPGGYRREGTAVVTKCPRCLKPNLRFRIIDPPKSTYPCRFTCFSASCSATKYAGHPEYALSEILGITLNETRVRLFGKNNTLVIKAGDFTKIDLDTEIETGTVTSLPEIKLPSTYLPLRHPASERGLAYLEGRGIPLAIAEHYGIRYSTTDRSVVFPVVYNGKLVGYQNRLVISHKWKDAEGNTHTSNKTSTSLGFKRQVWMFGDNLIDSDHAFVLEGPVDAIKAHKCGGNVASLGKELTSGLLNVLSSYRWKKLYCGLDKDAVIEITKLVKEYDQYYKYPDREVYLVNWPNRLDKDGKQIDAGAMDFEEVYDCYRTATKTSSNTVVFDIKKPFVGTLIVP